MADIEFLTPGADPLPDVEDRAAGRRSRGLRAQIPTTGAAALWATAAALGLLAPFRTLFVEQFAGAEAAGVDGWGRVSLVNRDAVGHAPRFGVPLLIAATVCAALAVVVAFTAWRGVRPARPFGTLVVPGAGLLAGGALLGVAAAAWQYADAIRDQVVYSSRVAGFEDLTVPAFRLGPLCALAAAGGLCAVLGSVAAWLPVPEPVAAPDEGAAATAGPAAELATGADSERDSERDSEADSQPGSDSDGAVGPSLDQPAAPDEREVLAVTLVSTRPAPDGPAEGEELLGR